MSAAERYLKMNFLQPYRRDVAFGLSTLVVRGNNLDDDDDSDDLDPTAAAAKQVCTFFNIFFCHLDSTALSPQRKSSYGVDMTHIDGVKKLKSKLSKQVRFFRTALWQALFLDTSAVVFKQS